MILFPGDLQGPISLWEHGFIYYPTDVEMDSHCSATALAGNTTNLVEPRDHVQQRQADTGELYNAVGADDIQHSGKIFYERHP